jgi:hypothetical protein
MLRVVIYVGLRIYLLKLTARSINIVMIKPLEVITDEEVFPDKTKLSNARSRLISVNKKQSRSTITPTVFMLQERCRRPKLYVGLDVSYVVPKIY